MSYLHPTQHTVLLSVSEWRALLVFLERCEFKRVLDDADVRRLLIKLEDYSQTWKNSLTDLSGSITIG